MFNNVHVWEFRWPMEVSSQKSIPRTILDVWGVALFFWNCPNPSEWTMDRRWSDRMLTYLSLVRVVFRPCMVLEFMRLSHTCTRLSARHNSKQDSSDQSTCLLASTVRWRSSRTQARRQALCCLCYMQEWAFDYKRRYQRWSTEQFVRWHLLMPQHWNLQQTEDVLNVYLIL